jgi:hypothetical protein
LLEGFEQFCIETSTKSKQKKFKELRSIVGLYGGDFYYWANIWIAKEIDQILGHVNRYIMI